MANLCISTQQLIQRQAREPNTYFYTNFDNGCCVEIDLDGTIYLHFNIDNSRKIYDKIIANLDQRFTRNYETQGNICYKNYGICVEIDKENEISLCIMCKNYEMLDEILRKRQQGSIIRTSQLMIYFHKWFS